MSKKVTAVIMPKTIKCGSRPAFRFPEFAENPEWQQTPLKSISQVNPKRDILADEAPVSFVPMSSVAESGYLLDHPVRRFSEVKKGFTFFRDRDIIFAKITPCFENGKAALAGNLKNGVGFGSTEFHVIRAHEGCLPEFLFAYLNTDKLRRLGKSAMTGSGGQQRVPIAFFEDYPVFLPEISEQRKIADCFSSIDVLLAIETQKLDALKAHKKGLMQQLLPREGENQPQLRFSEFRDAPEWEERKLETLAKRGSGHTPSKSKPEYYNGGIKWVSLADSKRLDNGLIAETTSEISEQGIQNSSAVLHPPGTVILSRDAGVGKSAIMSCPMAVSQHFIAWTCDRRQLSNWFLYYMLQKKKPLFERIATGSTIKTIGLPFFIDMRVSIPALPEQQRISSCLSSLDELIAAQTQKLEMLKAFKKGLMQQLFPSPDGTGL